MEQELLKRAKKRTLYLLEKMDRTEYQLRQKLQQNGYPKEVIDEAITYAASFKYIDDLGYARRYITGRMNRKSRLEMRAALLQKGIANEVVDEALEEVYQEEDSLSAIKSILEKKHFCIETATIYEKKKMQDYLLRKGFYYDDICQILQVFSSNT